VNDPIDDGLRLSREGRFADQALIEHRSERVDVGAAVEAVAGDLLRTQVRERADERARARHAAFRLCAGQSEVHHAHAAPAVLARHHDVFGFDVAMDDAARVAVVEGLGDLDADVEDVAEPTVLAQEPAQVGALNQRHHEVQRVFVAAEVVDGDDGRVVHLGDQLRLALEALLGFGAELRGRDQLDRDVSVQPRIACAVDDAHPTASELRDDLVPVSQPCSEHLTCSPRALSG
jgi:hypothetical protein